ncbi:MAG: 5-formyltetrahydrofolate cyclo-ligase, partial [Nitrososphaerales archaeon]|nr:5-formyltetrahydrofolate cyclo-ligase [Nitrososphaerales archaeon]
IQIVNNIPLDEYDVTLDIIVTPTRTIRVNKIHSKPTGIIWERLPPQKLNEIQLLKDLRGYLSISTSTFNFNKDG